MADQGSSYQAIMSTPILKSLDEKIPTNYAGQKNFGDSFVSLIYKIPVEIRELNKHAYIPSVVSIGPCNMHVGHLQITEADKLSYMQYLFSRFGNYIIHMEKQKGCAYAMLKMESNARKWYGELEIRAKLDIRDDTELSTKVAEMMLVDGCFIIELLYRNYLRITSPSNNLADPILDNYSMKTAVQHDLIRLENQIPLPVLEELFNLTVGTIKHYDNQFSLKNCIFLFFKGVMGLQSMPHSDHTHYFHILDYFHSLYRPSDSCLGVFQTNNEQSIFRYSATQLDLAGVKFRPGSKMNLFDVKFCTNPSCFQVFRSGHFEIPPFPITSSTETFLRNLIAMEQFYEDRYHYFTSHAFLMDKLIDTAKDVDLLVEAGVIQNYLGSSEEVARLYNNITKNVYVGGFHFTKPCNEVTEYCNRFWPRSLAKLKRDYFDNPWAGISILAAFSILVLTLLQTIYAMK